MKLREATLLNLGFNGFWPSGNPKEPWWENKELDITFFGKPTVNEFFDSLKEKYRKEGRRQVQDMIRESLAI